MAPVDPLDPPGLFACRLAPSVGEHESPLRRISGDAHDCVDRDLRRDHGNSGVNEECDTDVVDRSTTTVTAGEGGTSGMGGQPGGGQGGGMPGGDAPTRGAQGDGDAS